MSLYRMQLRHAPSSRSHGSLKGMNAGMFALYLALRVHARVHICIIMLTL